MSNRSLDAVFQHSKAKGSARLILLAMADEASDEGLLTAYRRSLSWLAHKANVDKATAKRAVATLVELGEVQVLVVGDGRTQSDYRLLLPGLKTAAGNEGGHPAPPAPMAAPRRPPRVRKASTEGAVECPPHQPLGNPVEPETPAAAGSERTEAYEVTRAFWEWCTAQGRPKPTLPAGRHGNAYKALEGIVSRLLDAGWTVPEVKHALTTTRAYTIDALTFSLTERRAQAGPRAPISDDREGPSGRVDL